MADPNAGDIRYGVSGALLHDTTDNTAIACSRHDDLSGYERAFPGACALKAACVDNSFEKKLGSLSLGVAENL